MRLGDQIGLTVMLKYGFGKHDYSLTPDQLIAILKYNWVRIGVQVLVSSLARISISILLIRLFGVYKWFKWFVCIVTSLVCVASTVLVIVTFVQSTPVEALWNIFLTNAHRWDTRVWLYLAYFAQCKSASTVY